jgi:hypothetical protein
MIEERICNYIEDGTDFINVGINDGFDLLSHKQISYHQVSDEIALDGVRYFFTKKVSVMKINVDSALKTISGAKFFLEEHKPTLFIKISDTEYKDTERLLNRLNYILLERLDVSHYLFFYM